MIDLYNYYMLLDSFDWYHGFSDDPKVAEKGRRTQSELVGMALQSPEHGKLYQAFKEHYFSGPAFATPKAPKPSIEGL